MSIPKISPMAELVEGKRWLIFELTSVKEFIMKPRTEISMQLYNMMSERGYPENLCDLVTRNLNTDYTATRMICYLSHYSYLPEVEVVDEMLAILSDRNAIIKKKESEQAQARINEIYRFGLDIE